MRQASHRPHGCSGQPHHCDLHAGLCAQWGLYLHDGHHGISLVLQKAHHRQHLQQSLSLSIMAWRASSRHHVQPTATEPHPCDFSILSYCAQSLEVQRLSGPLHEQQGCHLVTGHVQVVCVCCAPSTGSQTFGPHKHCRLWAVSQPPAWHQVRTGTTQPSLLVW